MARISRGFTSFLNDDLRDGNLPDHIIRFKLLMESHLGSSGKAIVKISTLASEMGKSWKSAQRIKNWFLKNSNLKARKRRYTLEYYTEPDMSVLYGKTKVSHIVVHPGEIIKITTEKDFSKNPTGDITNKEEERRKARELSGEEQALEDNLVKWHMNPLFKSKLTEKAERFRIRAVIYKHGYEVLNKLYVKEAENGVWPHPKNFWDEVNKLNKMASVPK